MTRDQLVRVLLRLGIAFVVLQIAVFVAILAVVAFMALGGDVPTPGAVLPEPPR